jgi:tetratricopeptide (TPR) repeat protein
MVNWKPYSNLMNFASRKLFSMATVILMACLGGFGMALGKFGATPTAGDLVAVARELGGRPGGGIVDKLWAMLWNAGGERGLSWGSWGLSFVLWSAVFVLVGWGCAGMAGRLSVRLRGPIVGGVLSMCVVVVGTSVFFAIRDWQKARLPMRLTVPSELFLRLPDDGTIFANRAAIFWAPLFAPGRVDDFIAMEGLADPEEWRTAAREAGVGAAVFAGAVSTYRPILEHLMASRDWRLADISNAGFVMLRDGSPNIIGPDVRRWNLGGDTETALYLAQISDKLSAINRLSDARAALDRARNLARDQPEVQLAVARFAMRFEKWGDVRDAARAARRHGAPIAVGGILEAKAEIEIGDLTAARDLLEGIIRVEPSNTQALLMLASVCKAQRDFISEAAVMESLVREARGQGMPEAGYLAYLGQAYAQAGRAVKAAESYRQALASGGLNPEQTQVVKESLAIIESRSIEARRTTPSAEKLDSRLDLDPMHN